MGGGEFFFFCFSLIHLSPLLKCLMTVCPSSLHSCVQGTNFFPIELPGEIMSFGVSPVNYSDSDSDSALYSVGLVTALYTGEREWHCLVTPCERVLEALH